ncbi:MAG: long-chain fatty acid--CoA ligase [Bacteroidota bacterium]|jgi:long-chain acyl-CoA synthetase
MNSKRLFDCLDHQLKNFPKQDMLAAKENGKWVSYSTTAVAEIVNQFSAGLLELGVSGNNFTPEGSDKIAILSNNRPEWVFTDLAAQQIGAILIPIYPTTNPLELEFILNDTATKYVFVSSKDLYDKVKDVTLKVPSVINIYSFDKLEGVPHWSEITQLATENAIKKVEEIKSKIPDSHLATIIYTSGTTGIPKGVMLRHSNIYSNVVYSKKSFPFEDAPETKVLSFLPLNHIFEKMCTYIYLYSGISIYYAESLETIGDNLKEIKPNGFTTVPRLLEKVFEKIMLAGSHLTGYKRSLFFWAVELAEKYDNIKSGGLWYNMQLAIANKLIFQRWREALGGNISFIITGGAACQVKLLRIFNAAKIPVYEGYGPTENSPVISVNRKEIGGTKFGTVGPPIEGIQVRLAEDGEIQVAGSCVMAGYYKRPDITAETIVDGWLLTGDIGVFENGKFLKIIDRKKELFKTSGGKYVAPQPIENKLMESPFVEQVIVLGSERKFVGALIVPSVATLKEWMREKEIAFTTIEDALHHPKVLELYRQLVESFNKFFNHVEQVKKFELLPREWSVNTGELTPKLSLKRKVIMERYKDAVERIYAE